MDSSRMETLLLALLCLSGWSVSSGRSRHYHYVAKCKNWTEAQSYCRQTYKDLAIIQSPEEVLQLNQTILSSGINSEVWIGEHSEIKLFGGYTENGAYYLDQRNKKLQPILICFTVDLQGSGDPRIRDCSQRLPFVCYSIPDVSVKVIKVRVKHQEPSLDLNDPAVNAALLKQFQDTLAEKGLSGVSLEWRKQPDDKVFHMEEKPKSVDESCTLTDGSMSQ